MIRAAIFGTLVLASVPVAAQAQSDALKQVWAETAAKDAQGAAMLKAATDCITSTATTLAKGSKETADVLADVAAYRCNDGSPERRAVFQMVPLRTMALDTVVRVRMGG